MRSYTRDIKNVLMIRASHNMLEYVPSLPLLLTSFHFTPPHFLKPHFLPSSKSFGMSIQNK